LCDAQFSRGSPSKNKVPTSGRHILLVVIQGFHTRKTSMQFWAMYPFLQETVTRTDIVTAECRLILRAQDALLRSRRILALPPPDSFLGRRNLIEPPPIERD